VAPSIRFLVVDLLLHSNQSSFLSLVAHVSSIALYPNPIIFPNFLAPMLTFPPVFALPLCSAFFFNPWLPPGMIEYSPCFFLCPVNVLPTFVPFPPPHVFARMVCRCAMTVFWRDLVDCCKKDCSLVDPCFASLSFLTNSSFCAFPLAPIPSFLDFSPQTKDVPRLSFLRCYGFITLAFLWVSPLSPLNSLGPKSSLFPYSLPLILRFFSTNSVY